MKFANLKVIQKIDTQYPYTSIGIPIPYEYEYVQCPVNCNMLSEKILFISQFLIMYWHTYYITYLSLKAKNQNENLSK